MTTTTELLVELTVAALRAGDTDAQDRIYSPGDWPTTPASFPNLMVRGVREDKVSLGKGAVEFTVTSTIRITGRVSAPGAPADQGGLRAEERLWRLQRQSEIAVINNDDIMRLLQQIPSVRTGFAVDATGQLQLAEILTDIEMEFYQGPEDFYPTLTTAIDDFEVALTPPGGAP